FASPQSSVGPQRARNPGPRSDCRDVRRDRRLPTVVFEQDATRSGCHRVHLSAATGGGRERDGYTSDRPGGESIVDAALQSGVDSAWPIAPELVIVGVATLLVLLGSYLPMETESERNAAARLCVTISALALGIPLVWLLVWGPSGPTEPLARSSFIHDPL